MSDPDFGIELHGPAVDDGDDCDDPAEKQDPQFQFAAPRVGRND
jgi:hypothetical protein